MHPNNRRTVEKVGVVRRWQAVEVPYVKQVEELAVRVSTHRDVTILRRRH
jgi:hypothetical protein